MGRYEDQQPQSNIKPPSLRGDAESLTPRIKSLVESLYSIQAHLFAPIPQPVSEKKNTGNVVEFDHPPIDSSISRAHTHLTDAEEAIKTILDRL